MDTIERLMDVDEVARMLGVSTAYVRKAAKAGRIPAYRLNDDDPRAAWKFRESELQEWISARRREVPA